MRCVKTLTEFNPSRAGLSGFKDKKIKFHIRAIVAQAILLHLRYNELFTIDEYGTINKY